MKLIKEVVNLILFKNGNDWYKMEDFKKNLVVNKLFNLRKI
jgi:hypothetical protein